MLATAGPTLNDQLASIYEEAMARSREKEKHMSHESSGGPAFPMLIQLPDGYEQARLKVAFFGQETNGWEGPFNGRKTVEELRSVYHRFVNKGGGFNYGGQYWNAVKNIQSVFEQLEPSSRFTAGNVIRIGRWDDKGSPTESVIQWQDHWFDVTRREMELLKPDVVIFMSGPYYDNRIARSFPQVSFEQANARPLRQFARVVHEALPRHSYRTYHPRYLWGHGFYEVRSKILEDLQQSRTASASLVAV